MPIDRGGNVDLNFFEPLRACCEQAANHSSLGDPVHMMETEFFLHEISDNRTDPAIHTSYMKAKSFHFQPPYDLEKSILYAKNRNGLR